MGRGLSYSLPVTYYELIPTAPVKYYCKILTVICARERNAGTLRARARAFVQARQRIASSHFRIFCQPVYILPEFISTTLHPGKRRDAAASLSAYFARCVSCTIDDNNNDNNHGHETATTFRFVQIGAFCSLLFRVFLSFFREGEGGGEIRQDTKHVFVIGRLRRNLNYFSFFLKLVKIWKWIFGLFTRLHKFRVQRNAILKEVCSLSRN